jgi:hypothetical protein
MIAAATTVAVTMAVTVAVIMIMVVITAVAAAMTATALVLEIFRAGKAAQLNGLGNVILDRITQAVHFLLGVDEAAGHRIGKQGVPAALKIVDFLVGQGDGLMLLLVECAALVHDRLVLRTGFVVAEEGLDLLAHGAHGRLVENGLAQILSLLQDGRVLGYS